MGFGRERLHDDVLIAVADQFARAAEVVAVLDVLRDPRRLLQREAFAVGGVGDELLGAERPGAANPIAAAARHTTVRMRITVRGG